MCSGLQLSFTFTDLYSTAYTIYFSFAVHNEAAGGSLCNADRQHSCPALCGMFGVKGHLKWFAIAIYSSSCHMHGYYT